MRRKHICSVGRHPRLLILLSLLLQVAAAHAELVVTDAGQLCTLPCSTCTITGAHDVKNDTALKFGDCNVELRGALNAEHSGESFTIAAGSFKLNNGKLRAPGTHDDSGGSISVEVTREFTMLGTAPRIDLDGADGGGSLSVTAGSADVRSGLISARGNTSESDGGSITLVGATVTIGGVLEAAADSGDGGTIVITACDLLVTGTLDARGTGTDATGGDNTLAGAKSLHVGASALLLATPCDDCNELKMREGAPEIDSGATIDPQEVVTLDTTLDACCGNGQPNLWIQDPEACDDGNRLWCDHCTPSCEAISPEFCDEDGNPCTGSCILETGCTLLSGTPCPDDGQICTIDTCAVGVCTHPSCADASPNPCRPGQCDPDLGCTYDPLPDGATCGSSACSAGVCRSGECMPCCDDGNPCTRERCHAESCVVEEVLSPALCSPCRNGDVLLPAGTPCAEGDPCSTHDVCDGAGTCVPGPPVRFPGSNPCIRTGSGGYYCRMVDNGCAFSCSGLPDGTPCSDNLVCTTGECRGGACINTPATCDSPCEGGLCPPSRCQEDYGCAPVTPSAGCADDGNPCTQGFCDPEDGCVHQPLSGVACPDDGDACTGDTCNAGVCDHPPLTCDDGDTCTDDFCEPAAGCVHDPAACDDGDPCTSDDSCVAGQCSGTPSCGNGDRETGCDEECDDGNRVEGDGCDATCHVEPACGPVPASGCRTPTVPGKAFLVVKDGITDAKDLLIWKWLEGAVTTNADFGSPDVDTNYQLCIYNGSPSLILDAAIPAGGLCGASNPKPCWQEKPWGWKYKDKDATPDGITDLVLREGLVDGAAKITLKGKGALLDAPAIPSVPPITVQLSNGSVCWEATYSVPLRNEGGSFKAKAD